MINDGTSGGKQKAEKLFSESIWDNYVLSTEYFGESIEIRGTRALKYTVALPRRAVEILSATSSQLFFIDDESRFRLINSIITALPDGAAEKAELQKVAEQAPVYVYADHVGHQALGPLGGFGGFGGFGGPL